MTACIFKANDYRDCVKLGLDDLVQVDGWNQLFVIDDYGDRWEVDHNGLHWIIDLGCSIIDDEFVYWV